MAARNNKATQSKYDHLLKLLLIGDSGEFQTRARRGLRSTVSRRLHPLPCGRREILMQLG